jgi:hypothetical protein
MVDKPTPFDTSEAATELARTLTDSGKLIEAGWIGFRLMVLPEDTPEMQLDEMRGAFFAGAHHLLSAVMTIMEPDAEPTDKDCERLNMIHQELEDFEAQLKLKVAQAEGSG